jgi:hypothetical protein
MNLPSLLFIALGVAYIVWQRTHDRNRRRTLRLRVDQLDFADEALVAQAPFGCMYERVLRAPDGDDNYVLFRLDVPIESKERQVHHVVLGARFVGTRIQAGVRDLAVNIALVTDDSVLKASTYRFEQGNFAAVGSATDISAKAQDRS